MKFPPKTCALRALRSVASLLGWVERLTPKSTTPPTVEATVWNHYLNFSDVMHPTRVGMTVALRSFQIKPNLIVETGSSAWGVQSSQLFDSFVQSFGGRFATVDNRQEASDQLQGKLGEQSQTFVDDSVNFLNQFQLPLGYEAISLLYLDSYDLDVDAPWPSMNHGLEEFKAAQRLLAPGSLVLIDDTPIDPSLWGWTGPAWEFFYKHGFVPGKGALVLQSSLMRDYKVLYHHYSVLLRKI